jgi:glycogen synthase
MSGGERPLRILMTADAVGGVWPYALSLARALGPRAEIVLAVMGAPPQPEQCRDAEEIGNTCVVAGDFPLEWMSGAAPRLDEAAAWLERLADEQRPDVLHVNGYAAAAAQWRAPVLVVAHSCVLSWWEAVHGTAAPREWSPYARRVAAGLSRADLVVAPTAAMLDALSRHYGGPRAGMVIANGIDAGAVPDGPRLPIVLAAGRLWDEGKNLATLDEAAARLGVPVYVAGETRHPDGRLFHAAALRPLGLLAPAALRQWMAQAAVYAHPARYEPFGLAVLEAAASGCALVLGDIPSLRELWNGAALFVPPNDAVELAIMLQKVLADDGTRRSLATAAMTRARQFTAAAMAEGYARVYRALLGRRTAPLGEAA